MAITNVQAISANDNGVGSSSPKAFLSNNSAGNLLVLTGVWTPRATTTTVSDTAGNTWLQAGTAANTGVENSNISIFYVQNSKAGANTVSLNYSTSSSNFGVWTIAEYTNGIAGTWTLDKFASNVPAASATAATSTATAALAQAVELVIGCFGTIRSNETFTAGSGFAIPTSGSTSGNAQAEALEWLAANSTAAQTATMTLSPATTYNGAIATFIPPSASAAPSLLMMMGLG